jgi:hypothetical protein
MDQCRWTGEARWYDFGVFFPDGVQEGGWVSPSELHPMSGERLLRANVTLGLGPLLPSCPVYVRHLERFELGTKYTQIIDHVQRLLRRAPFRSYGPYTHLLVDKTGVGAGVVDSFYERGVQPLSVSIHGGSTVTEDPPTNSFRVPKRDLVSTVQVLLQNGTLKIAPDLELAPTLKKELLNFRVKIDPRTAHDSYEHWREGDHDDLVLATALACWYHEMVRKEDVREWVWMGGKPPIKASEFDRLRP